MSVLFGWHVWLVLTGQGTIDYLDNSTREAEARAAGRRWVNPYHLGPAANWMETFDVWGRWWWLTWTLPTRRRKLGNGYDLKKVRQVSGKGKGEGGPRHGCLASGLLCGTAGPGWNWERSAGLLGQPDSRGWRMTLIRRRVIDAVASFVVCAAAAALLLSLMVGIVAVLVIA
jgi:hypothetical protein